ncbi:MAG: glycoside hydrolase family 2, partial [Gemmatimonadales bacterium]
SGGDHAMFTAILTAGYEIVYEPRALTRHRHRRSRKELLDAIHGYGVGVYASWTRALLRDGEWAVLPLAFRWFAGEQLPALLGGLAGRPRRTPPDLAWAELRGCIQGPLAYLRSRRRIRSASA